MSGSPLEIQRFGRSQTPESPRPVHLPEPSNIPVLLNQMDPVFNDTETYNIPHDQTFSPYPEPIAEGTQDFHTSAEEQDAVQSFFRNAEAETQAPTKNAVTLDPNEPFADSSVLTASALFPYSTAPTSQVPDEHQPDFTTFASVPDEYQTQKASASTLPQAALDGVPTGDAQTADDPQRRAQHDGAPDVENTPTTNGSNVDAQAIASGVDYQSLLDTISQSASTAPPTDGLTASTTASGPDHAPHALPAIPGLPAKPPSQETPADYSNYALNERVQPYQINRPIDHAAAQPQTSDIPMVDPQSANTIPPHHAAFGNGSFQPPGVETGLGSAQAGDTMNSAALAALQASLKMSPPDSAHIQDQTERPWSPRTQDAYDIFLEDERRFVTEGIWDKFPLGSRLFVGNLPSEKVTKRDLFHIFYKHGRLAQISIKQAYGFVQYLEASACGDALSVEQGVEIRGRKVHLEISKPQKNTRNAGGGGSKSSARRRSRSPDRGALRRADRHNFSDFRDEPGRRRDDYRPRRSPSPRGHRARDDYRPGESPYYGGRSDGRMRSPIHNSHYGLPQPGVFDEDAALPLDRRPPGKVPDVQVLILDGQVAQAFINWVEAGFRNKALTASTTWLSPRLPLAAVVKRQIIEGVQAVVKLTSATQMSGRISLQVFDRTAGASNVNFSEYADLDLQVAADIVLHARQKERSTMHPPSPQGYAPPNYNAMQGQYGQSPLNPPHPSFPPQLPPQYSGPPSQPQYQYPPQQGQYRPPQAPQTPVMPGPNPPNLQELLANLRQPPGSQPPSAQPPGPNGRPTDLGGLLSNIAARQQNQAGQYSQAPAPIPQPPQQQQYGGYNQGYRAGQQQGQQPPQQQNMQNIMDQLARYQR